MLAYKNIYANDGSMTPGMDGTTLDGMSSRRIDGIIASLRDHSYQPKPARREYIPKKSDPNKSGRWVSRLQMTSWYRKSSV